MDKNAIRKFATFARSELIQKVSQKALEFGISEENTSFTDKKVFTDEPLTNTEKTQLQALIKKIEEQGYNQVIEEVAYTWFNRFIALRFMEVNGYLPSHIRVFTDECDNLNPEILQEAINLQFENMDFEKVYELKEKSSDEELFKYLLILQCNDLNQYLPEMFQKINDYTELLLPDNLLRKDSIIDKMITEIPNEDWTEQVEIIGWLYQYYNEELKDKVFSDLKKNKKITKEKIPAATQLFTPDWIVRYMVDNSLGRLWLEGHPSSELKSKLEYFIEESDQEDDVKNQLNKIRAEYSKLIPQEIKCIDPCMGSGHVLSYLFDVLVMIYESYGIQKREAVASIIQNNLYGLDIDDRAGQLSYFSIMMKACQYDKRFLSRGINHNIYSIKESKNLSPLLIKIFTDGDNELENNLNKLIDQLKDAKQYGSLITVNSVNFELLKNRLNELENNRDILLSEQTINEFEGLINIGEILSGKYDIVVTNPPYMGTSNANGKLSEILKKNYGVSKNDLFAAFIERCIMFSKNKCYYSMITQHSWMFLTSYEKLRNKLLESSTIICMAHLGTRAFEEIGGEVVQTTIFVNRKSKTPSYKSSFIKLTNYNTSLEKKQKVLEAIKSDSCDYFYETDQSNFEKIPGSPIAYWASDNVIKAFDNGKPIGNVLDVKQGLATADNNRFLRLWQEVDINKCKFNAKSSDELLQSQKKWIPYNKGGQRRQWYGNYDYLVNWEKDGFEIRNFVDKNGKLRSRPQNRDSYFKEAITWGLITSGGFSIRYRSYGGIHDVSGMSAFFNGSLDLYYGLGLMSTKLSDFIFKMLNPTINLQVGDFKNFPVIIHKTKINIVDELVKENIGISKSDWDSFETSWDFGKHPFINGEKTIEQSFNTWNQITQKRFKELKSNEEELNRIFIDIYGLSDEMDEFVDDKDITLYRADVKNDVKSFISYAVGCMMGRYSLDKDGLVYAGGEFNSSNYVSFTADRDGIIPISDDEYFDDDIVHRFIEFVKVIYGEDNLEDNLKFIANALGGKSHSRAVIRNYFIKDFYKDHVKLYKKRPIYWLFDSGKKNGFKCLIYMHRYKKDTIARIRTDYIHEQQSRYRTALADLENRLNDSEGAEKIKLEKERDSIQEKSREILSYEEKIHSLADEMIEIDLDDGVKNNYDIFKNVLAKI
ncbi:MAG: BREX-1 system adenine-specific DNA-methyltransferase PglX [Finegoldia magna]|nr:BREX-1 system adenine-specific DNA-methyltransferase PglX [Finegoldia magna]